MTTEGTPVGTVQALYRYAVKSTAGQGLQSVDVTSRGLQHDRGWAIYTADGGIASGKRTRRFRPVPGLMQWSSEVPAGRDIPILESPHGDRFHADDPAASQVLSTAFGQQLRLRPETTVQHHDETPLHVVTTSSLAALAGLSGGAVDARRFRANIVIDTGADPVFQENDWAGAELAIGEHVLIRLGQGMPRCLMIDQDQRAVPRGPKTLRLLGTHCNTEFGLQAHPAQLGTISVGDKVTLRRPEAPGA
ncbi:MOSC domain-containing protein [Paenarthrobacter sp. NPDC057981]|uniref:MOSC domain-containing protein n=1 Tax=Paenarthrobacter sp. NPDC057981 TaxID=3346297 RepID=UPI0036DF788C